jgi:tetratricopeptide (TPR) repeat protein
MRGSPLWLKAPLGALVIGAVGLAAGLAALAAGVSLLGAAFAGIAAALGLAASFLLAYLFSRPKTQVFAERPASRPTYPRVLPPSIGDAFVGRSEVLREIHRMLRSSPQKQQVARPTVAIEGLGGIGKTRLALEYVHRYGHHYPGGLFWVDADTTPELREQQFHGILQALRPGTPALVELRKNNVDVANRVADALRDIPTGTPVLYVVDNLPEPRPGTVPEPVTHWCPAQGDVALLVTSRLQVSLAEGVDPIALPELESAASVAVLTEKLEPTGLPEEDWTAVAEWVGRLPLALVLLNAALRERAMPASTLRNLAKAGAETTGPLDDQKAALRGQVPKGSLRGITEAFAISYSLLSPEAQYLARLIAYLAPEPLPETLLDALGDDLASPEARAALRARSFVTPVPGTAVPVFGRMHRVLADFLRAQSTDPESELRELVGPVLGLLGWTTLENPKAWPVISSVVPHAYALVAGIERLADPGGVVAASELRARIANSLWAQGVVLAARTLGEQVLADDQRILGPDHPNTLSAAGNLANMLYAAGAFAAARSLQEQLLAQMQRVLGPDHPDTVKITGNLANTLLAQGDFDAARKLQERVRGDSRRILGPDHQVTIRAGGNLAAALFAQGELQAARTLQEEVLVDFQRVLGPDHPDTLLAAGNLANTLMAQREFAEAEKLQRQVLTDRRRILGPDHPDTVIAAGNLAIALRAQGRFAEARELQERVLADLQRILGRGHPNTLEAIGNLANSLAAGGEFSAARTLQEEVLAGLKNVLGRDHPDTVKAARNLAATLCAQGDWSAARTLQEHVLADYQRILGPAHPDSLRAKRELDQYERGPST